MTYEEIIAKVSLIIQDSSFSDTDLGTFINQAQIEVAGGLPSALGAWVTPPLPELLTISTVVTDPDAAYVSMPSTFQRSLQFVASSSGYEIDIAPSFISFSETYPLLDKVGRITEVIEAGGNFYYQGIPSEAEDVTLHFYRFPVDMEDAEDEPDGIPKHLHHGLLVNHAAWKIFEMVEDDFSEPGLNTQKYQALFYQSLKNLEFFIPYENRGLSLS